MRGARSPEWTVSILAVLLTVVLVVPTTVGAVLPSDLLEPAVVPEGAAADLAPRIADVTGTDCDDLASCATLWNAQTRWIDTAPIGLLPARAHAAADAQGLDPGPAPDAIPGYAMLPEAEQRDVWRSWLLIAQLRSSRAENVFDAPGPGLTGPASASTSTNATNATVVETKIGQPRGLRSLWSLDSHGYPNGVLSAGDAGETFLVTSEAVIKFPAPGARPAWMVKPGGYLVNAETVDANGDGVLDVVIGSYSFFTQDEASIIIVDGATGSPLFRGFADEDFVWAWTLTDVGGDGTLDILGIDVNSRLVVIGLDGTVTRSTQLEELPSLGAIGLLFFFVFVYYFDVSELLFADLDGDGVLDVVIGSMYYILVFGFLVGEFIFLPFLTVYAGASGELLWRRVASDAPAGWSFANVIGAGDFDADGADDLLVSVFDYVSPAPFVSFLSYGSDVYSGRDGERLARDRLDCVFVACNVLAPQYQPFALLDLDRDGAAEIVGLEIDFEFAGDDVVVRGLDVVGRVAPANGAMNSMEVWRHTWKLPSDQIIDGAFRIRDTDADGAPEIVAHLADYQEDESGNITDINTYLYVITHEAVTGGKTSALIAVQDYDESTGQSYGWTLPDDRWVPLDDEGRSIGRGMRLVLSASPAEIRDENGDTVPDMLLWKALGLMWVDGRSGRLMDDVRRPTTRYPTEVFDEGGRLRLLEREMVTGDYILVDLKTGADLWRVDSEDLDPRYGWSWIEAIVDLTGDGRVDLALGYYDYEDEWEEGYRVWDMAAAREQVWSMVTDDGDGDGYYWLSFDEVDPSHAGAEIVIEYSTWQGPGSLSVAVVGEDAARWEYNLGTDGRYLLGGDGFLVLADHQEGIVLEFLSAASGELLAQHALPADSWATRSMLHDVNRDGTPEAIVSYLVGSEDEGGATQHALMFDLADLSVLSAFRLSDPEEQRMYYDGYEFVFYDASYVTDAVGDWDSDGLVDFAYREENTPTIRSSATGRILAVAPSRGWVEWTPDLNGDGRPEIAMITDLGTLRLFASGSSSFTLEREDAVRVVADPDALQAHDEDFFANERGVPAPSLALVALALLGVAFVLRRRRL